MRKDMKDVIVNTGRVGGSGKSQYSRAFIRDTDPEDLPSRIPMGRRRLYGYESKELGDRISPLRAYLEAQVGRPWDDVYSEICEHADSRTIRGYHLRQHVWIEVEVKPDLRFHSWSPYGLFVDEDGILRNNRETQAERRRRWRTFQPTTRLATEDPDYYYEKIDGYWYSFQTEHICEPWSEEYLDMEDGEVVIRRTPQREHWRHVTTKKQVDGETSAMCDAAADKIDQKYLSA